MSMNDRENDHASEFNNLNITDGDSHPIIINHRNCSYCNKPFSEDLWCKECDPFKMIEGWTSGNPDIDKFIKDTMYSRKNGGWLKWVPFDKFTDIKQVGEGGFSKVYSATWMESGLTSTVALKRLNGSQNMSEVYLNEV